MPTRTITRAEVEFPEPFTSITSVRVLQDGRVIVADGRDKAVKLLDLGARRATSVGREGSGPGEYRNPTRLVPLAGDTSLLADGGNMRLLVLLPGARPGDVLTLPPSVSMEMLGSPRFADTLGNLYFQEGRRSTADRSGRFSPTLVDVLRFNRTSGTLDTIATLALPSGRFEASRALPGGMLRLIDTKPLAPEDVVAVAADGRVAVVRASDYHVEFGERDGRRPRGAPIAYQQIKVTEAERAAFVAGMTRPGTITTFVRGAPAPGGPPEPRAMAIPKGAPRLEDEPMDWPEYKAAFPPNAATFAPDGRLWVLRSRAHNDSTPTYDVLDTGGRVVERVALPRRTRLVGFGSGVVYLARTDDDDLQWLGRYRP